MEVVATDSANRQEDLEISSAPSVNSNQIVKVRHTPISFRQNRWQLVASPDSENGSLRIHQVTRTYLSLIDAGRELELNLSLGRHGWLQVLRGSVLLNDNPLDTSDGAAISDETILRVQATSNAEVMLFDLA